MNLRASYFFSCSFFDRKPLKNRKMSDSGSSLNSHLSQKTLFFGLKVWVVIGVVVGVFIVGILSVLAICVNVRSRRKAKRAADSLLISQIPAVFTEIKEIRVDHVFADSKAMNSANFCKAGEKDLEKGKGPGRARHQEGSSLSDSFSRKNNDCNSQSGDEGSSGTASVHKLSSSYPVAAPSPLTGLPELSYLGWGHWFTLRDLEMATDRFSKDNVLGEGGYGVVYRGRLVNGTQVAVKKLLNNL